MTIQEILEAHQIGSFSSDGHNRVMTCSGCREQLTGQGLSLDEIIRAHVAEVLDKHMQAGARQAQVNVLNGVASAWEEMASPGATHLYARMLRETAKRIGDETNGR